MASLEDSEDFAAYVDGHFDDIYGTVTAMLPAFSQVLLFLKVLKTLRITPGMLQYFEFPYPVSDTFMAQE